MQTEDTSEVDICAKRGISRSHSCAYLPPLTSRGFFFKLPNAVQVTPLGIVEDIWRHFQMFFVASTFFFFPLNLTRAEPQRCDETKTEHLSYMNIKLKQEEAFCSILSVVVRLSWRDFFWGGGFKQQHKIACTNFMPGLVTE